MPRNTSQFPNFTHAQLNRFGIPRLRTLCSNNNVDFDYSMSKAQLVQAVEAKQKTVKERKEQGNVRIAVVKRVEVTGKSCSNQHEHTIGLENFPDAEDGQIRILADMDDPDNCDKFHTTVADLRRALDLYEQAG